MSNFYKQLYSKHVEKIGNANEAVGGMDAEYVANFQMEILKSAGLKPNHNVYEIGAGSGRLLERLIPFLQSENGKYVGIEIVPELVTLANERIGKIVENSHDSFKVIEVLDSDTPSLGMKFDFICAFSVFTHMEAEDIVLKLRSLKEISHINTIGVFTFLPLEFSFGRSCFEWEARIDTETRYSKIRNVAFTLDMAKELIDLGGWLVIDSFWEELAEPLENGVPKTNQSWLILKPNFNI